MAEINRQEQASLQQELYAEKFVPEINQKSVELAAKNRNEFLSEVSGLDFPLSHRQPQIEDVLIMKGTLSRERLEMEQIRQQNRETEFCSFSPRLNNSNQRTKRTIGKIRSQEIYERLNGSYQAALLERELLHKQQKAEQERQALAQTTFEPDLSKTQRLNQRVGSRHMQQYTYKSQSSGREQSQGLRRPQTCRDAQFDKENVDNQTAKSYRNQMIVEKMLEDNAKGSETQRGSVGDQRSKLLNSFLTKPREKSKSQRNTAKSSRRNSGSYLKNAVKKQEYLSAASKSSSNQIQRSKATTINCERDLMKDDSSSYRHQQQQNQANSSFNNHAVFSGISPINEFSISPQDQFNSSD